MISLRAVPSITGHHVFPPYRFTRQDWQTRALDDPATLSAAVGALSSCNRTSEADAIYSYAIQRRILPDPVTGGTWAAARARASAARRNQHVTRQAREGAFVWSGEARGPGTEKDKLLWVDVRRVPVELVPAAIRRVLGATRSVGSVCEGLVIEWGGGRWAEQDGGNTASSAEDSERGVPSGRSASRAGRRENILTTLAQVEPLIDFKEPRNCRGQVSWGRFEQGYLFLSSSFSSHVPLAVLWQPGVARGLSLPFVQNV